MRGGREELGRSKRVSSYPPPESVRLDVFLHQSVVIRQSNTSVCAHPAAGTATGQRVLDLAALRNRFTLRASERDVGGSRVENIFDRKIEGKNETCVQVLFYLGFLVSFVLETRLNCIFIYICKPS